MRYHDGALELTASDLSQFLGCAHRTALELQVAQGMRAAPTWTDPALAVLQARGLEHERRFVDSLRISETVVVDCAERLAVDAVNQCLTAMRFGADVIVQGAFADNGWFGRPDVLRRVPQPSALGNWSYEVYDTKLAQETRGGSVLQLALYSALLSKAQGCDPKQFHVVTPNPEAPVQSFRLHDFAAYLRLIQNRMESAAVQSPVEVASANYPEPVEDCDVCRFWLECETRRRADDHLSLVAGMSRLQARELQIKGTNTLAGLGTLPLPLPFVPKRGGMQTYVRVREQARIQLQGRTQGTPYHEILPIEPELGLARLPAPSVGDTFLDIEGDPFARPGGREYLFGMSRLEADGSMSHHAYWCLNDAEEQAAFSAVVAFVLDTKKTYPGMHVYHYAPYETSALKRLMGRYATCEAEVDSMLRARLFVDLYAVVRHSVRASVERYSIKDLESFYGYTRCISLRDARQNLRIVERALELHAFDAITPDVRQAVQEYNRDDCVSAMRLRDWLESLRADLELAGTAVPRPSVAEGDPSEKVDEHAQRVQALYKALIRDVPVERAHRDDEQQARWLLAHLLDWHRREAKAPWWEFFRLRDLGEEELASEKAALSGLTLVARVGGTAKSPIDRYAYPHQDTDVRRKDDLHLPDGTTFGTVDSIDRVTRCIDVKKRGAQAEVHPSALFAHSVVPAGVVADALLRIGDEVVSNGIAHGPRYQVARDLLLRHSPRLRAGTFIQLADESATAFAVRVGSDLDRTALPIQGPPGAGKTYTGAQMICHLVAQGARVGVTAVSHAVIHNLLFEVVRAADNIGTAVACAHKVNDDAKEPSPIEEITDNAAAFNALTSGRINVLGGTAWLWARPEFHDSVDVLFVDEAAQMSLANALATSTSAKSVVLLGDPQQLEQPQQGSHPEGADVSALHHILQGKETIASSHGIFLPETWRLAPSICAFTSEAFYEGRLSSHAGLDRQILEGTGVVDGAGLWVLPVEHHGNQTSSTEEVDAIEALIKRLTCKQATWSDAHYTRHVLREQDILVVAPYNAQVTLLSERMSALGVRIGTVDKFQGQEAAVAIYSMATSRPEDAPRGMEFLYSLNRLNVATSRARCASVLVASPHLFTPACRSPRQMQLANAICRYRELAHVARFHFQNGT